MLSKSPGTVSGSGRASLQPGRGAALGPPKALQYRNHRQVQVSAVGDFFKSMFDFESWAPKSTRIWRLQQYQPPGSEVEQTDSSSTGPAESPTGISPDALSVLSDRISQLKDSQSRSPTTNSTSNAAVLEPPSSSNSSSADISNLAGLGDSSTGEAVKSFSDADDDELSAALGQRIKQIATATGEWGSSMDEQEMRQPLSGEEIRRLLLTKYGKSYDMSFVRRDVPGMKTFVSLNIMWLHLEQQSFKMTYDQYMEKLDSVAALVNVLGQTDKVRAFLKAPARSQKGLPRRPVVGTAISIRFDLDQAVIDEWFGQGYD